MGDTLYDSLIVLIKQKQRHLHNHEAEKLKIKSMDRPWSQIAYVEILTPSLACCLTLGKLFESLHASSFPKYKMGMDNACFVGLCRLNRLTHIMNLKQCLAQSKCCMNVTYYYPFIVWKKRKNILN